MEVAAGLVIAEEVVSSIIQGGAVGAVALAKPTLPLRCSLAQFAKAPTEDSSTGSLARAQHSINLVTGDLFIFGGMVGPQTLAGNEVHIIRLSNKDGPDSQYKCVPAIARDGESNDVPCARAGHTACGVGDNIVIYGGFSDPRSKQPIDEKGRVWIFSTTSLQWTHRDSQNSPPPLSEHSAAVHDGEVMVLQGARTGSNSSLATWTYSLSSNAWTELPPLETTAPSSLAIANGVLYTISSNPNSAPLSGVVHTFDLKSTEEALEWKTLPFPTNPLTPGPLPRKGAGLVPIHTGQGRSYLLYILGAKADGEGQTGGSHESAPLWSGIWSLQLPPTGGAGFKDAVRDKVGAETHEAEWAEVEIIPNEQVNTLEGKAHPGPRAWFACDTVPGTSKVLFWGGTDPEGKIAADGWVIDVKTPSTTGMLKNIPGLGKLMKGDDE